MEICKCMIVLKDRFEEFYSFAVTEMSEYDFRYFVKLNQLDIAKYIQSDGVYSAANTFKPILQKAVEMKVDLLGLYDSTKYDGAVEIYNLKDENIVSSLELKYEVS